MTGQNEILHRILYRWKCVHRVIYKSQQFTKKATYSTSHAPIMLMMNANGTVCIYGDFLTGLKEATQTHQCPLHVSKNLITQT